MISPRIPSAPTRSAFKLVGFGGVWGTVAVRTFARRITDRNFIGFDKRGRGQAIPIRNGLVMLGRFVRPAVFQPDQCILAERHQIGQKKPISGFNLVLIAHGRLCIPGAHGMTGQWQRHIHSTPIVSTASPLFRARAVRLRGLTIVEEESWIALERVQYGIVQEYERRSDKTAGSIATVFCTPRIEQNKILAALGRGMIAIRCMKVSHLIRANHEMARSALSISRTGPPSRRSAIR